MHLGNSEQRSSLDIIMYSFSNPKPEPGSKQHWLIMETEVRMIARDMVRTGEANVSYINDVAAANYPEVPYKRIKQLVLEGMLLAKNN